MSNKDEKLQVLKYGLVASDEQVLFYLIAEKGGEVRREGIPHKIYIHLVCGKLINEVKIAAAHIAKSS